MSVRHLTVGTIVALIVAATAGLLVWMSQDDTDTVNVNDPDFLEPIDPDKVIGEPVAFNYLSFDGEELNTSAFLGTPLVINLFAEWCAPCVREMPAFERVHQANLGEVAFLGLSSQETAEQGRAIIESTGITYDVGRDERGDAQVLFAATGLPTTVLLDRSGTIVYAHSGELTESELQALIDEHFG